MLGTERRDPLKLLLETFPPATVYDYLVNEVFVTKDFVHNSLCVVPHMPVKMHENTPVLCEKLTQKGNSFVEPLQIRI